MHKGEQEHSPFTFLSLSDILKMELLRSAGKSILTDATIQMRTAMG